MNDIKKFKYINEYTKELLDETYKKCGNINAAAKSLKADPKTIRRYMNLYKIQYSIKNCPRYECNHNFFSQRTPEVFYIAGFIAADGCISDNKYSNMLEINISRVDREILVKIKNLLEAEHPIDDHLNYNHNYDKSYEKSRLCITSNKLCNDLLEFGITPRKSRTYKMPQWLIDHPLVSHFIRGYIDGDGCFTPQQKPEGRENFPQMRINIRGTVKCLTAIKELFEKHCGLPNNTNVHVYNNCGSLDYLGNRKTGKIIDYIYQNATIYLERKYKIAKPYSYLDNYINNTIKIRGKWYN